MPNDWLKMEQMSNCRMKMDGFQFFMLLKKVFSSKFSHNFVLIHWLTQFSVYFNGQRIELVQLVFFRSKIEFRLFVSGFDEIVKILIEKGSPINIRDKYDDTPLFVASWNGIISNASMKSHLKWIEFWWNCCLGNEKIVELLLQSGSNVTITNGDGYSPLHLASQQGKFENENRKI